MQMHMDVDEVGLVGQGDAAAPLYVQVARTLRDDILTGARPKGEKLAAEPELAESMGVSRNTLRRAMSLLMDQKMVTQMKGRGTFVTYGAEPSVGVVKIGIVPLLGNEAVFSSAIKRGLQKVFETSPSVRWMSFPHVWERSMLELYLENRLDGIIVIAPPLAAAEAFCKLPHNFIPHAIVGSWGILRENNCVVVDSDHCSGEAEAADYLLNLGHTRIAWVGADCTYACAQFLRREGYLKALKEGGVPIDDGLIFEMRHGEAVDVFLDRLRRLFSGPNRPTAVLSGGYSYVNWTLRVAAECGLSVPDDLSVIGFDDNQLYEHLSPPMTTVKQPLEDIGVKAAELVLDQIYYRPLARREWLLKTEFIERVSCRRLGNKRDERQS